MSETLVPPRSEARPASGAPERPAERVVSFRVRSLFTVLGLVLGALVLVGFVLVAQHALTLIAISLFLALALNPAVLFFERRGLKRGRAVAAVSVVALLVVALFGLVLIPPLVDEITKFIDALPNLIQDITKGRGTLGHLADKYHLVDKAKNLGASGLGGAADPVLSFASGVVGTFVGTLIVFFATLFMLIEGREWRRRVLEVIPPGSRPRWQRIGSGLYRAVGGFVTGNLVASLLDAIVAAVLLLIVGVPYAIPIALLVAVLELLPFIGPALVVILMGLVGLINGVGSAAIVAGAMVVWHTIEGHWLRPLIYSRALTLSPLAVLVAFVTGTEVAGIFGAIVSIPIAGAIEVIVREIVSEREAVRESAVLPAGLVREEPNGGVEIERAPTPSG